MLNTVIRNGDYVSWFLIPDTYNQKQFDALVNMPRIQGMPDHRLDALWQEWVLNIGGKFSGPRTVAEFHGLDGRHANIKVDGDRVYVFQDPFEKTLFNIDDQWYEIVNFDRDKLPWFNWLFKEPGMSLTDLIKQFMDITEATLFTQTPVTVSYILKRYHYCRDQQEFIPSEIYLKLGVNG